MEKTIKVKLLRSIVVNKQAHKLNDIVEISEQEFKFLSTRDFVEEVKPSKTATKAKA